MRLHCYTDIEEMPVFNWFKVHASQDYSWLMIKPKSVSPKNVHALQAKWKSLYDQYLKAFGFNESFLAIIEKEREIALMQVELAETGNRTINTFIGLEKQKLNLLRSKTEAGANFYEIKTYVEKQMGFQIDIRKMSVMEFYTTLKTINTNGRQN